MVQPNATLLDRTQELDAPAVATSTGTMQKVESTSALIERLARDTSVDVDKFERLVQMQERGQARFAKEQFTIAMTEAQKAMRPIATDANNPQTHSRYASYAGLDRALRPLYTEHGFALSFNTGESEADAVLVLCRVSHSAGHSEDYRVLMPADGKGAKGGDVMTKTHAVGSAMSYGMRYLLKFIFNVAIGEDDDDGNGAAKTAPAAPRGFDDWWTDMEAAVDNGLKALEAAWNASRKELKEYAHKYRRREWAALKVKAEKVGQ